MVAPAAADPIATKQAQVDRLTRQVEEKGRKAATLTEQMNQARLRADTLTTRLRQAEADVEAADTRLGASRRSLRQQANDTYVRRTLTTVSVNPSADGFTIAVQKTYAASMASTREKALDEVKATKVVFDDQRANYAAAKKAADGALKAVSISQKAAAKAVADDEKTLGRIKGQLATLVAAEQARKAAAEARRVQADLAARTRVMAASRNRAAVAINDDVPAKPVPPGAAGAVEEARRQLGKPYRYGGSGPGSFDCSGLTSWAWRAAGVSLPHSAAAQYSVTTRIPLSALQPGDLVFYGRSIYHMGIYVGDGQMIEAPRTGFNVRYASIYRSDLAGAGRP